MRDTWSSTADASRCACVEGTGGMQALGDDDKANIHADDRRRVLKRQAIAFRSTRSTRARRQRLDVEGELTLVGETRPLDFDLALGAAGVLTATAVVTQCRLGMKPYSRSSAR